MGILDQLEQNSVWEVTESNTRKRTYRDEIKDILYGDDYKKHTFKTQEQAYKKSDELEAEGIHTTIARVVYS